MDSVLVSSSISAGLTWLVFLLLLCISGENTTNALDNIHPAIYDMPWELCPVRFQKCVWFVLRSAQDPLYLQGYASIKCSRALFKQVLK